MSDIIVDSTQALTSALQAVQGGDRILLQPGTYENLEYAFYNLTYAQGITIASADPLHPATLTHFDMVGSSGVTFSNVEMVTGDTGYFQFQVFSSDNVHFDHVSVHGSMDNNARNDIEGIRFQDSTNVSITNSEFQQLERAMSFGSSDHIVVAGNNVHNIEITGVSFAQVGDVQVTGNTFRDFDPVVGTDHPDAIQFLTSGTTAPSHDISVSHNVIFRGAGGATQGIFFRDQVGHLPFHNVTIDDNLIDATGFGGIAVGSAHDITVSGNVLISRNGPQDTTPLQVFDSENVTLINNQATIYGTDGDTGLVQSGNVVNGVVADGGVEALQNWLGVHDLGHLAASLLSGLPPAPAPPDPPPVGPVVVTPMPPPVAPMSNLQDLHLDLSSFRPGGFDFFL